MRKNVASIRDLRALAKRRLPGVLFDFVEGGAGSESSLRRNVLAFDEVVLLPRNLVNVTSREQMVRLFHRDYAVPFGFAPIGLANLIWPQAEQLAASLANAENMPFVLSTASASTIEEIAQICGANFWFQLYPCAREQITSDLLNRAEAVGCDVLVVTVDVAVPGKRDRDIRNGFGLPLRLGAMSILDFTRRLGWVAGTLKHGMPTFANLAPYTDKSIGTQSLAAFMASQISASFDWQALEGIRRRWSGHLVVKGILHPEDAKRAADLGIDGVVVSNHGGRQLESGPSTLTMVSKVRDRVGDQLTVLLDSGIRSGGDIVKALAAGADFALCGRAWLYGVAAGGEQGIKQVVDIFKDEIDRTLGQIGCSRVQDVNRNYLI